MKSRVIKKRVVSGIKYFKLNGHAHIWRVLNNKCSYAYPYHYGWQGEHENKAFIGELTMGGWIEITANEVKENLPLMIL